MLKLKKLTTKQFWIVIISSTLAVIITGISILSALVFTRFSIGTVPDDEQVASSAKYDHVVIFGVDGAGGYFEYADTPNFDRIYQNGNVTYTGYSQYPTTSAHNWTSMLHGVRYQTHGVNNDVASSTRFTNEKYPSIFKLYAEQNPNANMLSVCNWTPINYGIIEENIPGMRKINAKELASGDDNVIDTQVCTSILNYLNYSTPDILFMQFDSVDGVGHDVGYGGEGFGEQITFVDNLIGQIYDKYVANGCGENTLFITVSDHGHGTIYPGHGRNDADQRNVTLAVYGAKGDIINGKPGHFVTQDVASIVAYAMGLKQPKSWESKVPNNIFIGL